MKKNLVNGGHDCEKVYGFSDVKYKNENIEKFNILI